MIELRDWDSKFFGFNIAELYQTNFNDKELRNAVVSAKTQNVSLLVYDVSAHTKFSCEETVVLADRRHTYKFNLESSDLTQISSGPDVIEIYEGSESNDKLESLAVLAGKHSRFFSDPNFPKPAAIALYKAWMRASVKKEMADVVFIVRDNEGGIAGIGTGRIDSDGTGVPTLMAVGEHMVGKGLGRSFVLACMKWLKQSGVKTARITTQSENKLACNCYKRMGWELQERRDIFHIWLKSPTVKVAYL